MCHFHSDTAFPVDFLSRVGCSVLAGYHGDFRRSVFLCLFLVGVMGELMRMKGIDYVLLHWKGHRRRVKALMGPEEEELGAEDLKRFMGEEGIN